ncbi:MAG: hypothetical protein ACK5MY_06125 [Jhaorihella sp.]
MFIVLVGVVLFVSNPNIGIFVITLGVMVWTSAKSRNRRETVPGVADRVCENDRIEGPSSFGGIVAVRRELQDSRHGAGRTI